jgi:hypothetical protein
MNVKIFDATPGPIIPGAWRLLAGVFGFGFQRLIMSSFKKNQKERGSENATPSIPWSI